MRQGSSDREHVFAIVVGRQVATRRRERGLSQEYLAQQLGIKKKTLLRYEKGYAEIPLFLLLRSAAILKVSLADFVAPAIRSVRDDTCAVANSVMVNSGTEKQLSGPVGGTTVEHYDSGQQ